MTKMHLKFCIFIVFGIFITNSNCNNEFSLNLYDNMNHDKNANIVISPISIEQSLSILTLGARGSTASELHDILGQDEDLLLESLKNHSSSYITANKIYVKEDRKLNEKFQALIEKRIGYAVGETINFKNNVVAANTINEWVSNQTNHKITNLIDKELITEDTRIILVNAIYFRGVWKHKFSKENNFEGNFYKSEVDVGNKEYMQIKTDFNFNRFEELKASCVELPYENDDISMFIVLPNERTGLNDLLKSFHKLDFQKDIVEKLIKQKVDVTLPKFKTEYSVNLKNALKHMGVKEVFSSQADFRNLLSSPEPIELSDILHKAVIEVNEDGVIAVAATESQLISRCAEICEFLVAEHPFLYVIYDRGLEKILFMGEVRQ